MFYVLSFKFYRSCNRGLTQLVYTVCVFGCAAVMFRLAAPVTELQCNSLCHGRSCWRGRWFAENRQRFSQVSSEERCRQEKNAARNHQGRVISRQTLTEISAQR